MDRLVKKTWGEMACTRALDLTELTTRHADKYQNTPKSQRLMIAVSGIPGSGTLTHSRCNSCTP